MFRYLFVCLTCVPLLTSPASGQSMTNEDLANSATFNAVARAYGTGLNHRRDSRLEPEINVQQIRDALAHLDGVVLMETKTTKIRWNARLGQAEIWLNEQQVPMTWSHDSLGRLTFSTKLARGWIDVSGSFLFVDFSVRGPRQLSIAVIPSADADRQTGTPVVCAKVCACENGGGGCGEDDCYNQQTCTGSSANCIYKDPPPAPPPSNGSNCGCPIAVIGLYTAIPLCLLNHKRRR